MIGVVDVQIQAKYSSMPLDPMQAFVNSPSSIRLRNVPKRIGKWAIESVQFVAAYPDGSIKSADCVLVGGIWVGTIEGTQTSGTSKNGYTIFAGGTDENGNAVTGYVLGKGDIEILEADGTLTPEKTLAYVHLLSADSEGENDGDLWQTSGTWKIRQDGQDWLIGDDSGMIAELSAQLSAKQDQLSQDQLSAIDATVDERKTVVTYTQASGLPQWEGVIVGEIAGLQSSPHYTTQIPNAQYAETIRLGTGVISIGNYAFSRCSSLTNVTIPASVTSIGERAFTHCWKLTNVTIGNGVTSIGAWAFYGCSGLTNVTIGNAVTSIEVRAFYGCSGLTSISIPNSVTSIGDYAFYNCSSLTNVTIGNGVTSIGERAFFDCNNLTSVTIPNSVTSIGDGAFYYCSGLTSLTFKGKTLTEVQGMSNYPWGILNASIITTWNDASQEWVTAQGYATTTQLSTKQDQLSEAQLSAIDQDADALLTKFYVQGESQIYSFIASSTLSKSDFAAQDVYDTRTGTWTKNLTAIKTGTNVTSLETNLFNGVTTLNYFEGPELLLTIGGQQAFGGCTGLQTLILPKITHLPVNFCYGCTLLRNLTIPASVTYIGQNAFKNCTNLSVHFEEKSLTEVQAMLEYPWGLSATQITASKTATQTWVTEWVTGQNYATQTYAVKNDGGVAKIMSLTARQYERLEDKDPTTLYVIPEEV